MTVARMHAPTRMVHQALSAMQSALTRMDDAAFDLRASIRDLIDSEDHPAVVLQHLVDDERIDDVIYHLEVAKRMVKHYLRQH